MPKKKKKPEEDDDEGDEDEFAFLNLTELKQEWDNEDPKICNDEEINDSLLLGESAEFRIVLESKDDKTNIIVESLEGTKEEADSLLSKINELLS